MTSERKRKESKRRRREDKRAMKQATAMIAKTALDELTLTIHNCRLLQLPAEIRNKIYGYAVTTEPPIYIDPYGRIGAESRDIFSNVNTFRFEIEPGYCAVHFTELPYDEGSASRMRSMGYKILQNGPTYQLVLNFRLANYSFKEPERSIDAEFDTLRFVNNANEMLDGFIAKANAKGETPELDADRFRSVLKMFQRLCNDMLRPVGERSLA